MAVEDILKNLITENTIGVIHSILMMHTGLLELLSRLAILEIRTLTLKFARCFKS